MCIVGKNSTTLIYLKDFRGLPDTTMIMLNRRPDKQGKFGGTFGKPTHRTWFLDLNQGTKENKETLNVVYRWKGLDELNPPKMFPWTPSPHYDQAQLSAGQTGEV